MYPSCRCCKALGFIAADCILAKDFGFFGMWPYSIVYCSLQNFHFQFSPIQRNVENGN